MRISYMFSFVLIVVIKYLNGINEMVTRLNFTKKSATANDTQNGAVPKIPKIGICSEAQVTSLDGSKKLITLEKAIKKKMIVSIEEPNIEDIRGAFHHLPSLK